MEWFGRASVNFTHAPKPVPIRGRDGKETDLATLCEEVTPPCQLNPLLFNAHLQVAWVVSRKHGPQIYYRRKIFQADHETYRGSFAIDFVDKPFEETDETLPPRTVYYSQEEADALGSDDSRPQLVVLHGLSGGSHEDYLRHAIKPLVDSGKWEICVVNARGCAHSKITSAVLYNARATWDVRQAVKWLREKFPNRPLFGLGFSLGANILTNYLGEEGENCILEAAISCCNPFNLEVCNLAMARTWIGREVYQRAMGTGMRALVARHEKELAANTNLDMDELRNVTYLWEFDRAVQCPTWGYPTERAYYRDASSSDSVLAIRIPYFALHASDDPIAADEGVPYNEIKQNPYTVICSTSLGSHIGWFEIGGSRWYTRPICNFFNRMAFETSLEKPAPPVPVDGSIHKVSPGAFDPMRRRVAIPSPHS